MSIRKAVARGRATREQDRNDVHEKGRRKKDAAKAAHARHVAVARKRLNRKAFFAWWPRLSVTADRACGSAS